MPFDPKSITGISEKVLVSHYENNYVGAVKTQPNYSEREFPVIGIPAFSCHKAIRFRVELRRWNSPKGTLASNVSP
jgi:hypothetical protein